MRINQSEQTRDILSITLIILEALALLIGLYLVVTTVIVSKDSVTFIQYAKTMEQNFRQTVAGNAQHPGYPFLILSFHKFIEIFGGGSSLYSWIYSAQTVAFLSFMAALAALYAVGVILVGKKESFWAVLVLLLLPDVAHIGADALSDWPHLFFLSWGFLMLLLAVKNEKWQLLGAVGVLTGCSYLVRPEGIQLLIYTTICLIGALWLKRNLTAKQIGMMVLILVIVFAAIVLPYMYAKKAVFPKKPLDFVLPSLAADNTDTGRDYFHSTFSILERVFNAIVALFKRSSEILMYFFFPFWVTGLCYRFYKRHTNYLEKIFVSSVIILNIAVLVWLHIRYGYISRRHTLPLVCFTVFYVPVGIDVVAGWIAQRFHNKESEQRPVATVSRTWFFVILSIGIISCIPKLCRPVGSDKKAYLEAAKWLNTNTDVNAVISVPDVRIAFYAQRAGFDKPGSTTADYIVKVLSKKEIDKVVSPVQSGEVVYKYIDKRNKQVNVEIYRKL
jgi:hypothetical protein